jgi:hypothetical protein
VKDEKQDRRKLCIAATVSLNKNGVNNLKQKVRLINGNFQEYSVSKFR